MPVKYIYKSIEILIDLGTKEVNHEDKYDHNNRI